MPTSTRWVRRGTVMISDKIRPHHLERKAILYVRQSSAHQVLHNRESSALQYAMRDRLTTLGWSEIEVIDDDLGRSAAGGVQRAGFERMVAQVCLGKVGAVAAREVSRFARNSRDWQQAGLLRCRRCGRKLTLRYSGAKHHIPRYSCTRGWMDNGEPRCIAFGGLRVDDAIEGALLTVVGPGAIAAAVAAEKEARQRRDQVDEALRRDLEAARYAT